VGPSSSDGGPDHITPERFRRHLKYLKSRYDIVTVGEALARLRAGRAGRKPLLSLTFDDGYADNTAAALPILIDEGCRATMYPTLEAIEEGLPPWPHRLTSNLRRLVRGAAVVKDTTRTDEPEMLRLFLERLGSRSAPDRERGLGALVGVLKNLPDDERRRVCDRVADLAGPPAGRERSMIDAVDLKRWRDAGMEVGSHTTRHPILSRVEPVGRRADLSLSRAGLERILGIPVLHLAYPNGRAGDWDEGTIADARAAGFHSAVTTVEGINTRDLDPFEIRRISVGNDSLPILATRVSSLGVRLRSGFRGRKAHRRDGPAAARPLTIAFIGGRGIASAYSGIERYYEEIGSRLVDRGHRVLAYCRPHFAPDSPVYRGVEVRKLPTVRAKHLETLIHSTLATIDVCFRRVDLVQYHALGSSPLAWMPRLFGKRTVVSVRGLDWQRDKWGLFARLYLRFCETTSVRCPNATAVVSRTLKRHFETRFGRQVRYIPNGVARPATLAPDGIRRWGLDSRNYFLYAGRLSPEKGLGIMIEAHRPLAGVKLVLAGGSSYSEAYMEELRATARDGVVFTGFLTGTLLQEIYSNALAFVLPSRMEGLSVALLEAMSYGLPVIASDIPENRELVDECGGYLFRLDDVVDLRRVMQAIIQAPAEALQVGARARDRVRAGFDWDRIAGETAEFYREVVAGSGRTETKRAAGIPAPESRPLPPDGGLGA
jgi:glycosyltransferase involved in cell wall biosynthesis